MFRILLVSTLICGALCGQAVKFETGLSPDQVIPRKSDGKADLSFGGSAWGGEGSAVEARLSVRGIAAEGFDWRTIGRVQRGKWSDQIPAVPVGGPYRVEVRLPGTSAQDAVPGVLVGDLWLLAGQSDMEGRGYLREATSPHPLVHSFDMRDHWLLAEDPLHTRLDALDRAYWFLDERQNPEPWSGERLARYIRDRDRGAGLGLPFAVEMVRRTGVPVGLVPCALGGTSMDQWSPALKDRRGDSLYGAMVRRVRAAGGTLKGVLWSQGAGDADARQVAAFQARFEKFVASLREDLGQPVLPFYFVQIGRVVSGDDTGEYWNRIQEAQRQAETAIPYSAMVASVDESLLDLAHADAASLKRLGLRLAKLACRDSFPEVREYARLERGPRPVSAVYLEDPPSEFKYREKAVRVTFATVNGNLQAKERISGFSIHHPKAGPLPVIYAVDIDPADGRSVLIRVTGKPPAGAVLHYGFGLDPYCNVVDGADLPLPAFGPMEIR